MRAERKKPLASIDMETTQTAVETKQPSVTTKLGYFGEKGRYTEVMAELFTDTQRLLGFSKEQAHVTSVRLGIELGRLSSGKAEVKYGSKVSKDGFRTVKEVASIKMRECWPITIAVICNGLDTLRRQGLECVENTLADTLLESVNDAVKKLQGKAD